MTQFYLELEKAASEMVMLPNRASFNAQFINGIPPEWKREMITHDRIRADFSSPREMMDAASHIDKVIDGLNMVSAYREGTKPQLTNKRESEEHTAQRNLGRTDH